MQTRIRRSFFVLGLLCLLAVPLVAQDFEVRVVLEEVGLREQPGFIYKETGRLLPGEEVIVDEIREGWAHVAHMGWVPVRALKEASAGPRFEITVEVARLRAGPGTSFDVVGTARKGDTFEIFEQSNDWVRIGEGKWVFRSLGRMVQKTPRNLPAPPQPQEARTVPIIVLPPTVNLRAGPSTDHPVVRTAKQGEELEAIGQEGDWLKLTDGGWIRKDLVRPAVAPPPNAGPPPTAKLRQWGLLSLLGVYLKVVAVPGDAAVAIRTEEALNSLTDEEREYTFMTIMVDIPKQTNYRFNYSPSYNRVQVTDRKGRRFGNFIHKEGDLGKLPAGVRTLFQSAEVFPGMVHTGLLAFSGELDPAEIAKVELYMSGKMQELYEEQ